MKKSSVFRTLCCLLAVVLLLPACNNKKVETSQSSEIPDSQVVLAENGHTEYTIVIPADADPCETYASEELQLFFEQATEAEIDVVTDAGRTFSQNDKVISLGNTTIKEGSGLTVTEDELNMDGFTIKRFGNTVVIAGVAVQGTLYGVYEFLTRQFGFEPYLADEIYLNRTTDRVFVKDYDFADQPDFVGRDYDGNAFTNPQLGGRLRNNSSKQQDDRYGNSSVRKKFFGGISYDNAFSALLPSEEYEAKYPGWYQYAGNQMCLYYEERVGITYDDDASVLRHFVERMEEEILANIEAGDDGFIVSFAENDLGGYCNCPTCQAKLLEADGKRSALYIDFANRGIEKIEEWKKTQPLLAGRKFKYAVFSYGATIPAPVKEVAGQPGTYEPVAAWAVPNENLYVYYTPLGSCCYHSLFDKSCQTNKYYSDEWDKWHTLTNHFMIYDYNACYHNYLPFFDNFGVRQQQFQAYYEGGVETVIVQSTTGQSFSSMSDLHGYLELKMLWDVYVDVPQLIENFMTNVYKQAAPYMTEYFNLLRANLRATELRFQEEGRQFHLDVYSGSLYQYTTEVYSKQIVLQLSDLLDKAYAAFDDVADPMTRNTLQMRITKERFCLNYVILSNYGQYFDITAPAYAEMVYEFERNAALLGAIMRTESVGLSPFIEDLKSKIV